MRRGNKFTLIVAGALIVSAMAGCGKKEEATTTAATTAVAVTTEAATEATPADATEETTEAASTDDFEYEGKTAEDLVAMIKDPANPTVDEFVWLCSTLQYVNINDKLELETNVTWKAISQVNSAINDGNGTRPNSGEVYTALINSDSPQVRGYALNYIGGLFGASSDQIEELKRLAESETDLYVIKCILDAMSNELATDPAIAEYVLKMSEHENPRIRFQATLGLSNTWSKGVDGVVEAVIRLMGDEDEDVREYACKGAGDLDDDSVIEPLVNILNDPEQADLHGAAIEGLCTMWLDYPFHERTNEAAYTATMNYFKTTPRSQDIPAWTSISDVTHINDSKIDAWKGQATYFNADELVAAMYDILMDPDANWLARTGAIDAIFIYASPDYCRGLQSSIESLTDKDADNILTSYQKKLEKLDSAE